MNTFDEIDIHVLSLRIMDMYQQFDEKLAGGAVLLNVDNSAKLPEVLATSLSYGHLPCIEYTMRCGGTDNFHQPDITTFFTCETLAAIPNKSERENIYWRIRLMYGCGLLPIALIQLGKSLKTNGLASHFTGQVINSEGKAVKLTIPFENIKYRPFYYEPSSIHLVQKQYDFGVCKEQIEVSDAGYWTGVGLACHSVLVCNEEWIFDLSGMQFGMRGTHGELIGRLENKQDFINRFPAQFVNLKEDNDFWLFTALSLYQMNKSTIDKTWLAVLENVMDKKRWCNYCGKIPSDLKRCTGCRYALYCDKYCQTSDWKGHKHFCGKSEN